MTKDQQIKELEMETFDLIAKVVSVLHTHGLWGDDGTYTFPDGDRWARFEPEQEQEYLEHTNEETENYG